MEKKYNFLLVEDDLVDQMAFKRFFKKESSVFDYQIAGSVKEATEILEENEFDIILSDYNLGDGTAFDIIENANNTPVVIATGVGDEEIAVKAMKKGASDYLIKDEERTYLKMLPLSLYYPINIKTG